MSALRYVILHHTGFGEPHFDLMFETSPGSDLLTWRSDAWPIDPQSKLTPIAIHRGTYLDYQGEVSGGRGNVRRIHASTFNLQQNDADVFAGVFETGKTFRLNKSH
jgi:hypothetical protein